MVELGVLITIGVCLLIFYPLNLDSYKIIAITAELKQYLILITQLPPYKNITYIAYRNMLYFNHPLLISRH